MIEAFLVFFDPLLRPATYLGAFALVAGWELLAPRRPRSPAHAARWLNHALLLAVNVALLRLLFPAGAVVLAVTAAAHGWGLLNAIGLAPWLAVSLALLALDFTVYAQHVAAHAVPLLWRIHRVHHSDPEVDATTGVRFHPLEVVLAVLVRYATIVAIGAPPVAVVLYELALGISTFFIHGNVRLPARADRILRRAIVTPDLHRIHHSTRRRETDSNFGLWLSVWDRLFGTRRETPRDGQIRMAVGLTGLGAARDHARLTTMLALPARAQAPRARGSGVP